MQFGLHLLINDQLCICAVFRVGQPRSLYSAGIAGMLNLLA